jgi:potassium-transporting ATPase potassium-binding subunit
MNLLEFLSIMFFLVALLALTPLLGNYMAKALFNKKVLLTPIINPLERFIYRLCFIDPAEEMHWRRYASSLLWFSFLGFLTVFIVQIYQNALPLNPQGLPSIPWALAINTAISFVTNTNWQAYSGENTMSYLVSSLGLTVQNFISAAVGMAVLLAFIRGIVRKNMSSIGNFWVDVVRSILYVLLPLSLVVAIVLVSQGVVQNFSSYVSAITLEGQPQILPMGPAASQVAIKQLGTNGGGFFGVNSAHPFENPNHISNFLQLLLILLIPSALVYMFGVVTKAHKHALMIFLVILSMFLAIFAVSLWSEHRPNPSLGIESALEGKELRFSVTSSVLWSTATTAASNGSVNSMHDSLSPLAGGGALVQIMLGEIIFGGVGSGLYGMLLFVILTVFLAGLMVGRSPEYLGKKLEAFDMQMAVVGIILPSAVVLLGAGFSSVMPALLKSLSNQGPHGLSQILYAWASTANNNGSAFAGFNANTDFFNLAFSLAMALGRFGVMIPVLAIAGNLANKNTVPESLATFATDTATFAVLLTFVIIIIGALTFFPSLILGPLAEHLLMFSGRTF